VSRRLGCILTLLLAFVFSGEAVAASGDADLLERHRPILVYDADEQFFAQPVDTNAEVREGDRVYGHVAREAGRSWLQYWFFYAYNSQDRGIFATGRHEGDWELAQIRLGAGGRPEALTVAQHSWAESCAWGEIESDRGAPRLWIANGSHAVYPRAGVADRPWPDPNDEADGKGRVVRPRLIVMNEWSPSWVLRKQPWGASRAGFIPGENSSPRGPMFQPSDPWGRPAALDGRARACGSGPPGRLWQDVLTVLGALALAGAALLFTYRRVRRRGADSESRTTPAQ
jgi:hypothetical protein